MVVSMKCVIFKLLNYSKSKNMNLASKWSHDNMYKLERHPELEIIPEIINTNIWKENGIDHPFKVIQKELAPKGYYLQDISTDKETFCSDRYYRDLKYKIIIGPQIVICEEPLWHGLNVIPNSNTEMNILKPFVYKPY